MPNSNIPQEISSSLKGIFEPLGLSLTPINDWFGGGVSFTSFS